MSDRPLEAWQAYERAIAFTEDCAIGAFLGDRLVSPERTRLSSQAHASQQEKRAIQAESRINPAARLSTTCAPR